MKVSALVPAVCLVMCVSGCTSGGNALPSPEPSPSPQLPPMPAPSPAPLPTASGPIRVASGALQAIGWAADAEHLYWLQHDGGDPLGDEEYAGSLWRVGLTPGATPEALVRDLRSPSGLSADETFLYFSRAATTREVARVRKTGGPVEALFPADGIPTLEGAFVYWKARQVIYRHAKDGSGADEVILDLRRGRSAELVTYDTTASVTCALALVAHDATVVCTSPGAASRAVASERSHWVAGAMVIDGRDVYWRSVDRHDQVMRASLDGPAGAPPTPVLSSGDPETPIELVDVRHGHLFVERGLLGLVEVDPAAHTDHAWIPEMSRMSGETDYLPVFIDDTRVAWVGFAITPDGERNFDAAGIWTTPRR